MSSINIRDSGQVASPLGSVGGFLMECYEKGLIGPEGYVFALKRKHMRDHIFFSEAAGTGRRPRIGGEGIEVLEKPYALRLDSQGKFI